MHSSLCGAHLEAMWALARCMGVRDMVNSHRVAESVALAAAVAPAVALVSPAWHGLHGLLHTLVLEAEVRVLQACLLAACSWECSMAQHYACPSQPHTKPVHCPCS